MEKQLEELNKACSIAEKAGVEMLKKSHISGYTRQDGSQVAEHEDSRQAAVKASAAADERTRDTVGNTGEFKRGISLSHMVGAQLHSAAAVALLDHKKKTDGKDWKNIDADIDHHFSSAAIHSKAARQDDEEQRRKRR